MTKIVPMRTEGRYASKDLERLVDELAELQQYKEIMCSKEAAEALGISVTQLYRLHGVVPAHKVPGMGWRYLRDEIIDYIKKH